MAGFDANTKLLIHFDGADASTTFTDRVGNALTANGNAQLDTAQKKFGTASLLLDGAGDYAAITYASDLLIGTGDFGIDFWCMPAANQTQTMLFANRQSAADSFYIMRIGTTTNVVNVGSGAAAANLTAGSALTNNVWSHIFFGRQGTTYYLGINGTVTSGTTAGSNNYSGTTNPRIGSDEVGDQGQFNGWIDEVRMQVGTCPWTANFTPPTAQYSFDTTGVAVEAASAADARSSVAAFASSGSDALTAADSVNGGTPFVRAITEAATAADSGSTAAAFRSAVGEAASAASAQSALARFPASVIEAATAASQSFSVLKSVVQAIRRTPYVLQKLRDDQPTLQKLRSVPPKLIN